MTTRILCLGAVLALSGLTGCGSGGDDPAGSGGTGGSGGATGCAAILPSCLVNQLACAEDGAGPHCVSCASGQYADSGGSCQSLPGTPLSYTFEPHTTQPGEEILDQCRSWTLNNETELWVNSVELTQDEASHHSNWMFVPDTTYAGPDGVWKCADRGYDELTAALSGGVLFAQSTQATHEVQKFPDGVVVRIPPHYRITSEVHLLNTTADPVTGQMTLSVYAIPAADVSVKLTPFHVSYDGLAIPPRATSRFSGTCELDSYFKQQGAPGFDMKVYYLLPHTHALATRMFIEVAGGPLDGTSLVDVRGFNSEPRGRRWDTPLDVTGSTGLRFGCEFQNPRNVEVNWGFGDQEMCEALGFADSKILFDSHIHSHTADGTEGSIQKFTGGCGTVAVPWSQTK